MHQTQSRSGKAKYIKRKKGLVSSLKGVSHLFVHAKRRSYCRLQLWMWRKWREKWGFGVIRAKKNGCGLKLDRCLHLRASSQKNKRKIPAIRHTDLHASTSAALSTLVCDSEIKEETLRGQNHLLNPHGVSQYSAASRSSPNQLTDTNGPAGAISKTMPSQRGETTGQVIKTAKPSKRSHAVNPVLSTASEACGGNMRFPSGQYTTVEPDQDKDERLTNKKASHADVSFKALTTEIHEFLDEFYRIYGSFTPLQKSDLLRYLKRKFNVDFSDRKNFIFSEVTRYRNATAQTPVPRFRVVYKKHTLSLDDLSTLADQNWLNDQVMNMYGELIVESAHHKVHFLNSFFHRQLMTKGYDGVKRWTKQVDLFSKSLLLVPVHLVVHWCLVTADFVRKKICLYDSQGHALQKVARNILKYLMAEAKEKQQTAFENGWTVSFDEKIPQQTNENDCGVFVLEYSRCLALEQPLQFSQDDIPNIRKRIYKELCDCKLHEEGKTKM